MNPAGDAMQGQAHVNLVRAVAGDALRRTVDQALAILRQQPSALSGEDSGLGTVWLEFCAQIQGEHSVDWDAFEALVRDVIEGELMALQPTERQAMWLGTEAGADWIGEPAAGEGAIPISIEDLVNLAYSTVWQRAADWQDGRLERFLAADGGFDDDCDDDGDDDREGDS